MEKYIEKKSSLTDTERIELERYRAFNKKAILNYSDMTLLLSKEGIITRSNVSFNHNLGYTENELKGKSVLDFGSDFKKLKKIIENFNEDIVIEGTFYLGTKNGEDIPIELTLVEYLEDDLKFLLICKDLRFSQSENIKAKKVQAIFESGKHIIWSIDRAYNLTSFNSNYAKTFLKLYQVEARQNVNLLELEFRNNNSEQKEFWKEKYTQVFNGESINFEAKLSNKDGTINYRQVHLNPVIDDNNVIIEISAIALDITDQKNTEIQLNKNRARYDSIFYNSAISIWSINKDKKLTASNHQFNINMRKWFNRLVSINSDFEHYFLDNTNKQQFENFRKQITQAFNNKKRLFEFSFKTNVGDEKHLEIYMSPIEFSQGIIKEISCVAIDITENKNAAKALSESLHEKETLLREIHHRVKNNLQIISSILNLQSSTVKNEKTLAILTECKNRIRSMSFIHESLYGNNNLSEVDFSDYIKSLSANLFQSYAINPDLIKFIVEINNIKLSIDQAIPCGLIINELISNSLKHAFPENRRGEIKLNISENKKQIQIDFSDNGIGSEVDFDLQNNSSLGLQLVLILVEQLDGNIKIINKEGLNFLINFEKI